MNRAGGIAAIAGALWATSVYAQQARVDVFGKTQPGVKAQRDGAVISSGAEFTLYELNVWDARGRTLTGKPALARSGFATQDGSPSLSPAILPRATDLTMLVQPTAAQVVRPTVTPAISAGCGGRFALAPLRFSISASANMARRTFYPLVRDAECRYGIPAGLMDSLILQESRYNPLIVSSKGAGGLSQLMPGTAIGLGVADRFDPRANVEGGARYLRKLLDQFGSIPLALAAYNAGPGSVMRAGGIPQNRETPGYVRNILGYWSEPTATLANPASPAHRMAVLLGFMTN